MCCYTGRTTDTLASFPDHSQILSCHHDFSLRLWDVTREWGYWYYEGVNNYMLVLSTSTITDLPSITSQYLYSGTTYRSENVLSTYEGLALFPGPCIASVTYSVAKDWRWAGDLGTRLWKTAFGKSADTRDNLFVCRFQRLVVVLRKKAMAGGTGQLSPSRTEKW